MVTINQLALTGLTDAVGSLLPPLTPGLERHLLISSVRVTPTGIGGFVEVNRDPLGDITGRRLEARLSVNLRAGNTSQLTDAVNDHTLSLLAPDRAALLNLGIYRIAVEEVASGAGDGQGNEQQSISLSVLYEFLRLPEQAGDVILEVPVSLELAPQPAAPAPQPLAPPEPPREVLSADFMDGSLDWFEVVDDPAATRNRPSQWQYNLAQLRIEQLSNIWGGSSLANANKPGTYLVLRTSSAPEVQDFDFTVRMSSEDDDVIGLVFRWQDVDNFYFFVMNSERNYRLMGKKVAGAFALLDTSAVDETQGYVVGQTHDVRINAVGPDLRVFVDGNPALQGADSSIPTAGRVGFLSRSNDQSYFYRMDLERA